MGVIRQDLVGHEVPYILANTNPLSVKFFAFGWESSLINQVVYWFIEQEVQHRADVVVSAIGLAKRGRLDDFRESIVQHEAHVHQAKEPTISLSTGLV
jgi:hypothetical protein